MAQFPYQLLENDPRDDPSFSFDDSLYCQEEHWEVEDRAEDVSGVHELRYRGIISNAVTINNTSLDCYTKGCIEHISIENHAQIRYPEFSCEHHELSTLLSKEQENRLPDTRQLDTPLALARSEAVKWVLRVYTHYSFSLHTASLAINYFDRFLFGFTFQREKPWMTQLAAVACLSIAAKVEETRVPLLVDLQVQNPKYVFDGKTIQSMELLVLSTLEWKMTAATPNSFLDYMTRRIALEHNFCWEVLWRCERVLLAIYCDCRFMSFLPSVVALATMLHVMSTVETYPEESYQNQLFGIIGIDKDKVEECGRLIVDLSEEANVYLLPCKMKSTSLPTSPDAVIDVSFSSHGLNGSWAVASSLSSSRSVSSSPQPLVKKRKADQN